MIDARVVRTLVAALLLLMLGAQNPSSVPKTPWATLDAAQVGLAGEAGTHIRLERHSARRAVLRAVGGPGGVTLTLPASAGERFFGLGARYGRLDLRGQVLHNRTADPVGRPGPATYSPMPFLLSSRGYGLHLDTTVHAVFDLSKPDSVMIHVAADEVVVQLLTGPGPATVIRAHARLIGLPPVPPAWGLGVWKCLIGGTDRVLADVDALLAAEVPFDAVWIYDLMDDRSGFGWPWQIYGPVPPGDYPDPAALIAQLHARELRVLGYLHPFLVPGRSGYAEATARDYLVRSAGGSVFTEPWIDGDRRAYLDFTNPEATRWWQDRLREAVTVTGLDGAMQDYGEDAPIDGIYSDGRPGALVRNEYPVLYARAAREAVQSVRPDGTVLFARSGYTGAQSYVTGRFTGDQTRDWDPQTGLPSVLAGVLNGGLSGWPYWGPDIGGFFDGTGARDRDLWTRWVQLGALSPVMRDHLGAQADSVGIHTDAAELATFRGYARLHHAMTPYLHAQAEGSHRTGLPIVRPLWLAASADPIAWTVEDQYLVGRDLLVAPVVASDVKVRRVYLPEGRWHSYWDGTVHTGPDWVTAAAEQIPMFIRDGATLTLPPPAALGLP